MTAFERAMRLLHVAEGVWSDDPRDPGGPTLYGISLRFAQTVDLDRDGRPDLDLDGDGFVSADELRRMPRERAVEIYEACFWRPLKCDWMFWPLSAAVFDAGVNQGRGPAVAMLQEALNAEMGVKLAVDGLIGPATLEQVCRGTDEVLFRYLAKRAMRYAATAGFDRWGEGWLKRLSRIAHAHG